MDKREYWLDYLRAFACVLVALGHLFMSFQEANIIKSGGAITIFINLIYCFHVSIFFFCSGYLFQASNRKSSSVPHFYQLEKCLNFLILYVLFSAVTYVMKIIFSSEVNTSVEHSFFETLTRYPINQMWYLYAISAIFLFAYQIHSSESFYVVFGTAVVLKLISCVPSIVPLIPPPFSFVFQNLIWFVLGQLFVYKQIILNKEVSFLLALLFIFSFTAKALFNLNISILNTTLTLLGLTASTGILYNLTNTKNKVTGIWNYLSDYMLQIYLLHTIFAAGIRAVLFKLGISHFIPHLAFGIIFSFVFPIICAKIAEKISFLNIFFFPVKTFKTFFIPHNSTYL